jgi:hypothetical protein
MGIAFLFVLFFLHCLFVPEASFVAAFPDPHFPVPRPAHFLQQHFWVLDVLYCIVSPVFLTAYLRLLVSAGWLEHSWLVSAVYYVILLLKGFHLALLLLPAARQAGAHTRHRCGCVTSHSAQQARQQL